MTSPFKPVRPGGSLSAREINRLFGLLESLAKMTASPPLEVVRQPDGYHLRFTRPPSVWVKVTGKDKDDSGATPPDFHYSGTQQLDSTDDPATTDLTTGLNFLADTFPLVEVNGATDVETDTIVRAWMGDGGDYYVFDNSGGGSGGLERVRVTSATPTTVNSCNYSAGMLLKPGTHPGCNWTDGENVWVTPGSCSALVNGAEYWAKRVTAVAVSGETRPTFLALQRADCCDCGDTPDGYTTEHTCTIDLSGTVCVDGSPVKKTAQYCLPFKVAKHSKSETVDPAACGGTTDVEVPITPITITQDGCTFVFRYTSKILRLPSSWVLTGHTFP